MKKIMLALPIVILVAGCNSDAGKIAGGAAVGATIADGDNKVEGAALGALAGAMVAGAQRQAETCVYRNTTTGERFTAPCGSY